jgi:hypothetical protein
VCNEGRGSSLKLGPRFDPLETLPAYLLRAGSQGAAEGAQRVVIFNIEQRQCRLQFATEQIAFAPTSIWLEVSGVKGLFPFMSTTGAAASGKNLI